MVYTIYKPKIGCEGCFFNAIIKEVRSPEICVDQGGKSIENAESKDD